MKAINRRNAIKSVGAVGVASILPSGVMAQNLKLMSMIQTCKAEYKKYGNLNESWWVLIRDFIDQTENQGPQWIELADGFKVDASKPQVEIANEINAYLQPKRDKLKPDFSYNDLEKNYKEARHPINKIKVEMLEKIEIEKDKQKSLPVYKAIQKLESKMDASLDRYHDLIESVLDFPVQSQSDLKIKCEYIASLGDSLDSLEGAHKRLIASFTPLIQASR